MLVRVGVARVLRGLARLGDLLVTLVRDSQDILDLMRLARHLVIDELQLRGQSQAGFGADQRTQPPFRLIERLLGALALPLLAPIMPKLGPVHLGDLQVIGDAHIGDGHARKPLVVQLSFHRRRDHPLDQRRDSCGARVRSCHKNPFPRLRGEPLTISLVSYSHIPYSKAHSESFSIRNMRGLRTLAHNRTKPKSPEFRPSAANTVHWRKTGGAHEP